MHYLIPHGGHDTMARVYWQQPRLISYWSGLVLPEFVDCLQKIEGGLTSHQWSQLSLEGLHKPEVQHTIYRYIQYLKDVFKFQHSRPVHERTRVLCQNQ